MGLENRVAVVTGATGNLGRVVAKHFAEQGARLALFGTNAEKLENLAHELNLSADRVLSHVVDLRNTEATKAAAITVMAKFGRVDILLNLVGGWTGGKSIGEFVASEVDKMLQQHLWTTFHLAQAFVPHLVANRWGRVIVVSSPTATHPPAHASPYAIAKAAQEALMLTLAQELKNSGVTANILQVKTIDAQHERNRERTPKNASWTTPEEIAATILYLCSDEAQVVNGARIPLYGAP
ncbi:MAG: SDR family NAD(P)-dependent oxidoreductase [Chloroflexi bacterium]|nr:SDR family NAD(P)-dependent oxidoreductase [Chloroflexota bacterium]